MEIDDITGQIVDAAYKLHTRLGPGLLESVYETVLGRELERRGLAVERQKAVSFEEREIWGVFAWIWSRVLSSSN